MGVSSPDSSRLRVLSVGSNAVSAFISWRLQESRAADVTLVWRSQCEAVQQYGLSFRSDVFGHDRFRPGRAVRTVEEAAQAHEGYDYVFVCVKALPDVYDLAEVIRPVVTPSHTCIVLNTTSAIGIEDRLMEAYPRNMLLSLCSSVDITQTGPLDFEHNGAKNVHVGAVRSNATLPPEAQQDMTESLVLTLEAGGVDCGQTQNIRKHQWERLMGPISLFSVACLSQQPDLSQLLKEERTSTLVNNIFDELLALADRQGCDYSFDFKQRTLSRMTATNAPKVANTMWQDLQARRPLEIEVYLATPLRMAREVDLAVPRLEAVYALLYQLNKSNQEIAPALGGAAPPAQRLAPQHTGQSMMMGGQMRPMLQRNMTDGMAMQGNPNSGRAMSLMYGPPPQQQSYQNNGFGRGPPPAARPPGPRAISRQNSLDGLEEFAVYNEMYEGEQSQGDARRPRAQENGSRGTFANMNKRLANMRVGKGKSRRHAAFDEDDDEDDVYEDPQHANGQYAHVDPDQVDMLAMTRRAGRASSMGNRAPSMHPGRGGSRPPARQTRSSSQLLLGSMPGMHDSITQSALFGMGDNRYGTVDSRSLVKNGGSRSNTMQSSVQPPSQSNRSAGPPNSMQSRGPYRNNQANMSTQSLRSGPPPPAIQRQQILSSSNAAAMAGGYPTMTSEKPTEGHHGGSRSVTGSASASFGSLGKSSGSSSSSLERQQAMHR
ncbi:hypothetical protein PYCC9005_005576 [Savitreella phatthalungensis]